MENQQTIVFTLDEVNEILKYLGELPSKYSLDLITFIRAKAQQQINADKENAAPEDKSTEETKVSE